MKTLTLIALLAVSHVAHAEHFRNNAPDCMAKNIYFEARGESKKSWLAVAWVTLNRLKSSKFPDTVCGVVLQPYQFSWTKDGKSDNIDWHNKISIKTWKRIKHFTETFLNNYRYIADPTQGATYYRATYSKPHWASEYTVTARIDNQVYYRPQS